MVKLHSLVRLSAKETGETKCVIFVDSLASARKSLEPHVSTIVAAYPFIGAFGAEVHLHSLTDLASLPCVKAISPHTMVTAALKKTRSALHIDTACAQNLGYGAGISVAVIDTGVRPHLDFSIPENRIQFHDFIAGGESAYDDNGHGTAVASILCGNGMASGGKYCGVAPRAKLFALKAIGSGGEGGAFAILEAMQWIYDHAETHNIRVVCMSFGSTPVDGGLDPLSAGAEALWKKGIVVVSSAGNDGPGFKTIKSPGCNPHIITVGAARVSEFGVTVPDFSSRGPCGRFMKPDLIAPAVDIIACGLTTDYESFTGTSMAAPITAGAATLMLSCRPDLTPNRVKELLLNSAHPLGYAPETAGRGLLNFSFFDEL